MDTDDFDKLKLVLALKGYEVDCGNFGSRFWARIQMLHYLTSIGEDNPLELVYKDRFKYFAYGKTLDEAKKKLMKQWYAHNKN
jgi:hypothetical protein